MTDTLDNELALRKQQEEAEERQHLRNLYVRKISDIYFSKGIANLNKIVGLDSKSQFSLGLFLKLGINFDLIHLKKEEEFKVVENLDLKNPDHVIQFVFGNMRAYVVNSELAKKGQVHMKFSYHNEQQLELLTQALQEPIAITFLTFVYLHEVQHILRKHNTSVFNDIMLKTAQSVDTKWKEYGEIHEFANMAEDYCINYAIGELFDRSGSNFKNDFSVISKYVLHDTKYAKDNEVDVLIKILKQEPEITVVSEDEHSITVDIQEKNEDGSNKGDPKRMTFPKQGTGDGHEGESDVNKGVSAVADSIQNHIDAQKLKGEGSFLLNEDIGESIKTNIDWFDKLKSTFFTIVNRKTKQTLVNWSKLNSKYAHSHKSPTHKNIDNTLDIVLAVDNSCSMSTESLKKLLYIIEKKRSKINNITILRFTDTITGVLANENDEKKILSFLSKRDGGGTSHRDVFRYLDEHIDKHTMDKSIFISFSDNYSDIESEYKNFKNIKKITKVWLNSDGKPVEDFIPGMKVDIF